MDIDELPAGFSRAQARSFGLSGRDLTRAVADGTLLRVARGRYRRPEDPYAFEARRAAHLAEAEAELLCHPGGYVLAELTAAMAFGLPVPLEPIGPVHLCVDTAEQHSHRTSQVVIHHGDSVVMVPSQAAGMPCTPIARTLADCLRLRPPTVSVPLADDALRRGMCRIGDIADELKLQAYWRGRPRALASLALVDGRRESWLESRGFLALHQLAIDLPVPQVIVLTRDGDFVGRVDGLWAEDNTALEVDGKTKYHLPDRFGTVDPTAAMAAQEVRQAGLEAVGLHVVRSDAAGVLHPGDTLASAVREGRARGRSERFTGRLIYPDFTGLWLPPGRA